MGFNSAFKRLIEVHNMADGERLCSATQEQVLVKRSPEKWIGLYQAPVERESECVVISE
jgi:hypothetical protein